MFRFVSHSGFITSLFLLGGGGGATFLAEILFVYVVQSNLDYLDGDSTYIFTYRIYSIRSGGGGGGGASIY